MSKSKQKKSKINKKKVVFALTVLALIIAIPTILVLTNNKKKGEPEAPVNGGTTTNPPKEEKKLQIVDVNSKSRPIAVMINNHHDAWPHYGLQDAYMVYEIIAEGGITRMMAIYKDQDTARIGSVRSSRHYYLDYALENDAIYAHFGWSPQAQEDIDTLGVANINGLYDSAFWRDTTLNKAYEHTAFTSIEKLKASAKQKNYREETNKDLLFNYSIESIDIDKQVGAIDANHVDVKYSTYHTSTYDYDSANKVYKRSMSGVKHVDGATGKQYTAKNIIVAKVSNGSMDEYGRQELNNIGTGKGYYITEGKAVPITWEKKSRSGQTVYKYENGKEITLNDGNTFIQIQPTNQELTIS